MDCTQPTNSDLENPLISPGHWHIDPGITFLNHGSFGACPKPVLETQRALQERMESELVDFLLRDLEGLIDENRAKLADFLDGNPKRMVFVPNATTGVNAVVQSLNLPPGSEILTTTHVYNACANILEIKADHISGSVNYLDLPFPVANPDTWLESLAANLSEKTSLVLLDHISSSSALLFPVKEMIGIIRQVTPRAIIIIDGAHAPGQIPVSLLDLNADFYTGNLHKWVMTPKSVAFIHCGSDELIGQLRPLTISHGANSRRIDRPFHQLEFDWVGTIDPTPVLCIQSAIEWVEKSVPGGWQVLMDRNHRLACEARRELCGHWGVDSPCPDSIIPAMATIFLPKGLPEFPPTANQLLPGLQEKLRSEFQIEVPTPSLRNRQDKWIRVSCQAYNSMNQYRQLASAIQSLRSDPD